jgi:hypothetical protein
MLIRSRDASPLTPQLLVMKIANGDKEEKEITLDTKEIKFSQLSSAIQLILKLQLLSGLPVLLMLMQLTALSLPVAAGQKVKI